RPGTLAEIKLCMKVGGGRLALDFEGTAPQMACARNIPHQALIATVYTVTKCMLDPDVPANAGYFRTIEITAPQGSIVGPVAPAAVGSRANSCGVLGDAIASALSQAMPDKALAGSGPHQTVIFAGPNPETGQYFVNLETVAGGMGARPYKDGVD